MPKETKKSGSATKAKAHRHGYRGYGSPLSKKGEGYGGSIHVGRGFGGAGIAGEDASMLPPRPGSSGEDLGLTESPKDSSKKK